MRLVSCRSVGLCILLCLLYSELSQATPKRVVEDITIQDLTLLLPLTSGKVKATYLLQAYNGCFKWTSNNPEIVVVEPVYETDKCEDQNAEKNPFFEATATDSGCSTACIVTVTQSVFERRSSFIVAEDLISGRKVPCEVYVDKIDRIEIQTRSRRMYHDNVEELTINAYDSIGNLFSTLEGLQFQWSIVAANPNTATPPLKFVPFAESNIEVSDVLLDMERQGKESSSVLVRGVESGKATVIARLAELGYNLVDQSSVMISVLEPLELHPLQPVYLTPGTMLQYELHTFKNEYTRVISMPNPQYLWGTTNSTVATVDSRGLVQAVTLGSTEIVVQYEDMNENNAQGHVTVVWPSHLALKIVPLTEEGTGNIGATSTNWYLVNGRQYSLTVEVYDPHSHRIMTSPDMEFSVELPRESFSVTDHSRNHAQHSIIALREGLAQISARLSHLVHSVSRQRISLPVPLVVRQEVVISSPVVVSPSHLRFPHDPNSRVTHTYLLSAAGGTNEYNWYSADNKITTVNPRGRVTSGALGETKVMAADTKNPTNRGLCTVSVLPVASVKIIPLRREAFIGEELILAIAFYDAAGNLFNNCTALSFQWSISDESVFVPAQSQLHPEDLPAEQRSILQQACTFRTVRAVAAGYTNIVVSFAQLRADITFFAYNPLTVAPSETLVSLGSSYMFELIGGPNPWYFEPSTYQASLTPENSKLIRFEEIPETGGRTNFRVTCLDHGEQQIIFSVGNRPTLSNPFPATSVATARFSCYLPTSLFVLPAIQNEVKSPKCPDSFSWQISRDSGQTEDYSALPSSFAVKTDQTIPLKIALLDFNGNSFDNFTSIDFRWSSNNPIIAKFKGDTSSSQSLLEIFEKSGESSVTAQLNSFDKAQLQRARVTADTSKLERLRKTVTISAVENVHLSPQSQMLFLHPSNIGFVDILGGSSLTGISSNDSSAAALRLSETKSNQIEIIPHIAANIRLTVTDKCLQASEPSYAYVLISRISRINLSLATAIPVGGSTELGVTITDSMGRSFNPSQFEFMGIQSHQDNNLIRVEPGNSPDKFQVHGILPGSSSISFYSTASGISSETHSIYVYPPFDIDPKELVLSPGISYQLQTTGGPPSGITVHFECTRCSVASVDDHGIVKALAVGSTVIRASATGFDSITGQTRSYGEVQTVVVVRELTDIQIKHASSVIVVGSEMNVMALGPQGETPFSYGSDLQFTWSGSNADVLEIMPRLAEPGVIIEEENSFSALLVARKPGKSRISVFADLPKKSMLAARGQLRASILVTVIEALELLHDSTILVTPYSSFKIETNLDYLPTLKYSVLTNNCESSYQPCTVTEQGLIETTARTGHCYILIQEPDSAQSTVLQVDIKPIDMMQLLPTAERVPIQLTLPLGEEMDFRVIYLDDLGRKFHHVHLAEEFTVATNAQEIISYRIFASKQLIHVQGLRPGSAILRAGKTNEIDDYIRITVGNSITPRSPLVHEGGEIQFTPQFTKDMEDSAAVWRSLTPEILSVDSRTGLANGLKAGRGLVSFLYGEHETTTSVTIAQVDQIGTLLSESERRLTNYQVGSKPLRIPLQFWSDGRSLNISDSGNIIRNNLIVKCSITPNIWATARPSTNKNNPECLISMNDMKSINMDNQVLPELLNLHVSVSNPRNSYSYETTLVFPFYPEFVLVGSNANHLHLFRNRLFGQIQIRHGLSDIVTSTTSENIAVRRISSHLDTSVFEVQILDPENSVSGEIIISSPSTGQERTVDVTYTNTKAMFENDWDYSQSSTTYASEKTSLIEKHQPQNSSTSLILLLLATIAALVIGYVVFKPNTTPTVEKLKSPSKISTPKKGGEYSYVEHSPGVAQPVVTPFMSTTPRT